MFKKNFFLNSLLLLIIIGILIGYYTHYNKKIYFPQKKWKDTFLPHFTIEVKNPTKKYQLTLLLTYNQKYNFQNLYIQHTILKKEKKIITNTCEIKLFHPISGKPLGTGWYKKKTAKIILLQNYQFPQKGKYTLQIEQFMRKKILQGIIAISLETKISS